LATESEAGFDFAIVDGEGTAGSTRPSHPAKDGNQFTAAYGQLTASCNACHQSYDPTTIAIQPPPPFSDQDFRRLRSKRRRRRF
jgi:hypothetical protein